MQWDGVDEVQFFNKGSETALAVTLGGVGGFPYVGVIDLRFPWVVSSQ